MRKAARTLLLLSALTVAGLPATASAAVVAGGGSECEDSSLSALAETHETARGEGNTRASPS